MNSLELLGPLAWGEPCGTAQLKACAEDFQVVECRGLVATAHATFQGPGVAGVPHQVGARADMAAKGFMILVARAQGQRQVVTQAPLIFGEQCPGGLLEVLIGDAVGDLGVPPLRTNRGDVGFAHWSDQLGIHDQIGRLQLAVVADYDRRETCVRVANRVAWNGTAEGLRSVVGDAAFQRTEAQTPGMAERDLITLEAQDHNLKNLQHKQLLTF